MSLDAAVLKPYRVILGSIEETDSIRKKINFILLNPNSGSPVVCVENFSGKIYESVAEIFKRARPFFVKKAREDFVKFMHNGKIGEPPSCLTEITIEELE